MKQYTKIALALVLSLACCSALCGQGNKGYVTGSLESNSIGYVNDNRIPVTVPEGGIGSNNYLKVDYYRGALSAGLQAEAYAPALVGFPTNLHGAKLANFYVDWRSRSLGLTAGTFYDQFGSGLLFRSYEDRALGYNTAVLGGRLTYSLGGIVDVKVLGGLPRLPMTAERAAADRHVVYNEWSKTLIGGADVSLSLSNLLGWESATVAVEGSVLGRRGAVEPKAVAAGVDVSQLNVGYSGRLNVESGGFVARAEWVDAGRNYFATSIAPNGYFVKNSNAQLVDLGYSGGGLGVNLSVRRLEWMESLIDYTDVVRGDENITNNYLNYVPALCAQYSYTLTNINPYIPECYYINDYYGLYSSGEIGGQLDVYYHFRRGTLLGGKRGMKMNFNLSTYYNLKEEGSALPDNRLWLNVNVGMEKFFTRKFKLKALYAMQQRNINHGMNDVSATAHIFVADMLYKYTPKLSTRLELQYLYSQDDMNGYDWMAALFEINWAPRWSLYAGDTFNHGAERVHYYNFGVSYTASRTRIALGYGRNRAGLVCSGGVCRTMPAYTGGNLTITSSF